MSITCGTLRAAANRSTESDYEDRKLQDFSSEQVQAFRTAFDHIDSKIPVNTGWLLAAMKTINVSLPSQQLRDILYAANEDAITGKRIEFEEFVFLSLFLATYFQKINGIFEKRDFTTSMSTKPMETKLYHREKPLKMPHVISHYAAGIRLQGASEAKMVREIARLRHTSVENSNSPYAELLVLRYFNDRVISHTNKAGMKIESSAEKCMTTKLHALQRNNSTLPQIDVKRTNRVFHARYGVDANKPRPRSNPITTTEKELLSVESKRPHSCFPKTIDVSNASPTIVKQRLKRTIKDYRFYPMES